MSIGFGDHEGFHRAAIAMTVAGAAAGAGAQVVGLSPIIAGGLGAMAGALWAERPQRGALMAARIAMTAAGLGIALAFRPALQLWMVAVVIASALALGRGAKAWLLASAVGVIAIAAGGFAAMRIAGAAETASWPGWITMAVAGAAMGLTSVVALVPTRVAVERDPVLAAMRALPATVDAEIADLARQGARVWHEVKQRVPATDGGRALVKDGVLRLVEVAKRSERIPTDLAASTAKVSARIDELDARIAAATDEIARTQYGEARGALDDQRRYLAGIGTARERMVARMHNYLAALEKFRLAVVSLETAATARAAADARPALTAVAEIGADLESCGQALAELEAPAALTA
ncbi:MAG: hypothetical protein K8W52_25375 [Deltaproteobacteria bacterium]|nr:hypothetical protein [Deltaproteobacteria bacterium]